MSYRSIARLLGILLILLAMFMASSIGWSIHYGESQTTWAFAVSSSVTLLSGIGLYLRGRKIKGSIGRREALFAVTAAWLLLGVFGALPYVLDGAFSDFSDAFFESISGFTTTGSTVLTDVESLSRGLHYWRTLTHWLGGMGIIVLFIAVFPQLGVGAKHLFRSEVPGPITEGLKPKIRETASTLWKIYITLTLVECGLLHLAGMSVFDALCHSFSTMSTGGFSTKNASIAHFDSLAIELIVSVFMFIAGINFALYYGLFRGNLRALLRDSELRVYLTVIGLVTLAITLSIVAIHPNIFAGLRYALFQVLAIVTTTGFSTDNFDLYPPFSKLLLVTLMFVGGCAGSTAGGMKISRVMVLSKATFIEIYRIFRPQAVKTVKIGKAVMPDEITKSIFGFFALAIFVAVLGSIFLGLLGLDVVTASTAVVAALFNIGPGLAKVGSIENFAFIPVTGKLFLAGCMILGRLEFYTVLVLFVPDFWKK